MGTFAQAFRFNFQTAELHLALVNCAMASAADTPEFAKHCFCCYERYRLNYMQVKNITCACGARLEQNDEPLKICYGANDVAAPTFVRQQRGGNHCAKKDSKDVAARPDRQESQRRVRAGKKANVSRQEENVKDGRLRVIGFRPAANATEHRALRAASFQ